MYVIWERKNETSEETLMRRSKSINKETPNREMKRLKKISDRRYSEENG